MAHAGDANMSLPWNKATRHSLCRNAALAIESAREACRLSLRAIDRAKKIVQSSRDMLDAVTTRTWKDEETSLFDSRL
ncbi:MAG TPA: hypothetical protein VFZ98_06385 [Vicinamibacterales bacterium]